MALESRSVEVEDLGRQVRIAYCLTKAVLTVLCIAAGP